MTEMSASAKCETLQVSKFCLESRITIGFIVFLFTVPFEAIYFMLDRGSV